MPKAADLTAELTLKKDKYDKAMKDAEKAPQKLGNEFDNLGKGIMAAFSVGVLMEFTRKSIQAYDIQAKADSALLQALNGRKDIQQDLIAQAGELQKTTLFGDEGTVEAQKQLAVMGLTKKQIMDLIPLIQDFATVKQMDLKTAAEMVAKSIGTESNALKRSGIDLEGFTTKTEKTNEVLRVFNQRYGGQAVVAAQAGTGAMEQAGNAAGELAETFGKLVATNTGGFFSQLTKDLLNLNDALNSEAIPAWKKFFGLFNVGMQQEIKMQAKAAAMFEEAKNKELKARIESIDLIRQQSADQIEANEIIKNSNDEKLKAIKESDKKAFEEKKKNAAAEVQVAKDMYQKLEELRDSQIDMSNVGNVGNNLLGTLNPNNVEIPDFEIEPIEIPVDIQKFNEDLQTALQSWTDFQQSLRDLIEELMANTISGLAEGIGEAIGSGEGMQQAFTNILGMFGGFLKKMGAMMVAYGIAELALFDSWELGPVGAVALIAAGAALGVLGGMISGAANKISEGGGSTSGMSGGGYGGSSGGYGGGYGDMGGQLVAEVSGDKLLFILQRAQKNSYRIGG